MSRVDLFAEIRRASRVEGLSVRALAARFSVHRRTVRQALESAMPPERKQPVRMSPRLDPLKIAIDQMLRVDLTAPRKQRHTATRIHQRLIQEHEVSELSYSTVRDYVARRRPEINAEAGNLPEVFIPQEHAPGAEAEVDFGEVYLTIAGEKTKCHMFALRLSHSGKAIHRVYPTEAQEAFLQGHIEAFEELGGIPIRHIRYDNLTSAVKRVVFGDGRKRVENDRWVLFRSHYGFDAFYCRAGIEGAHEKGGIEGEIGRFRRRWFVPVPEVQDLAELNERIRQWDREDDKRVIHGKKRMVFEDFDTEAPLLQPLPPERFEPGITLTPRVDRSGLITVRMAKYSVPVALIGRKVRVCLRACELVVFDKSKEVARHLRVTRKGGQSIALDHYLDVLGRKPGSLIGSTALAQARSKGLFTKTHDEFWEKARAALGDGAGTRVLVEVLLLHRQLPFEDVLAGMRHAVKNNALNVDVVALEARLHRAFPSSNQGEIDEVKAHDNEAIISDLPLDRRPLPSVAKYDDLLAITERRTGT